MSKDTKVYSSLISPNDTEFILAAASNKSLTTYSFCANGFNNQIPTIWIWLPYIGNKGEHLLKRCIRKVKRIYTTDIKFVVLYNTKKISYYCTVKDKISLAQRSSVIYHDIY